MCIRDRLGKGMIDEVRGIAVILQFVPICFCIFIGKNFGHGIGTVSYTHLDVYKRQALFNVRRFAFPGFLPNLPVGHQIDKICGEGHGKQCRSEGHAQLRNPQRCGIKTG